MERNEVLAIVDAYLIERQKEKHTGNLMVWFPMNQGGLGQPRPYRVQNDRAPEPSGLLFKMVD